MERRVAGCVERTGTCWTTKPRSSSTVSTSERWMRSRGRCSPSEDPGSTRENFTANHPRVGQHLREGSLLLCSGRGEGLQVPDREHLASRRRVRSPRMIIAYTDGACAAQGPGRAGIGVAFYHADKIPEDNFPPFHTICQPIGIATNNVAEYKAVIE